MARTLGEIAARLAVSCPSGQEDLPITGVGIDSRTVDPGALWVARRGATTHAAAHPAPQAGAVLTDAAGRDLLQGSAMPVLVVDDPGAVLASLAAWFWDHPATAMTLVGVTGTNGKTTVTHLVEGALRTLGLRTGIIGTLGARIDGVPLPLARTTPESPDLHALFARMRDAAVHSVAMEVSSHALVLGRVDGITYDVAIFTNLTQDHLDFHPTMEDYFRAKAMLFTTQRARASIVCIDDEWGRRLADEVRGTMPLRTYGMSSEADVRTRVLTRSSTGMDIEIVDGPLVLVGRTALPGDFNAVNIAGAYTALTALGHDPQAVVAALTSYGGVPGRMERVADDPLVVVDYAHTPDAVRIVLSSLRPAARRLIVVLGCGGDRDREKRPVMGRIAAEAADMVIVTDDNPRSEDPASIRAAVLAGAAQGVAQVLEVGDRRSAIAAAVAAAEAGDVIAVLGKGAEQGQEVAGVVTPFDDRDVVREIVGARMGA